MNLTDTPNDLRAPTLLADAYNGPGHEAGPPIIPVDPTHSGYYCVETLLISPCIPVYYIIRTLPVAPVRT